MDCDCGRRNNPCNLRGPPGHVETLFSPTDVGALYFAGVQVASHPAAFTGASVPAIAIADRPPGGYPLSATLPLGNRAPPFSKGVPPLAAPASVTHGAS